MRPPFKKIGVPFERNYCGIGNIIIPRGVDRDNYVDRCFRTGSVTLMVKDNLDISHDVEIDPSILERLDFPQGVDQMGSSVVWLNVPFYNKPVIIAKLNRLDEYNSLSESEFSLAREDESGSVSILGNAKRRSILVDVRGKSGEKGTFNINVGNDTSTGEYKIEVKGVYTASVSGKISTTSYEEKYDAVRDVKEKKDTYSKITYEEVESRVKEGTSGHKYNDSEYIIGEGSEAAALGDALGTFMGTFIDTVAASTVTTALGPQPLLNAVQILALKKDIDSFISKYLKVQ